MSVNNLSFNVVPKVETTDYIVGYISVPNISPENISVTNLVDVIKYNKNEIFIPTYPTALKASDGNTRLIFNYDARSTDYDADFYRNYDVTVANNVLEKYLSCPKKKIDVQGIDVSLSNSWGLKINPGYVVRPYIVTDDEPVDSWVTIKIDALNIAVPGTIVEGDILYFIYTIPEIMYNVSTTAGTISSAAGNQFPGGFVRTVKENVDLISGTVISYKGNLQTLRKITIDGVVLFNSTFADVPNGIVNGIDYKYKKIQLSRKVSVFSNIEIEYEEQPAYYNYTGYFNGTTWIGCDFNPTSGHYIHDGTTDGSSFEALKGQVLTYLNPVSFIHEKYVVNNNVALDYGGTLTYNVYTGHKESETHFVRHKVYDSVEEDIVVRPSNNSVNTWGFGVLNINHYDESGTTGVDVFDTTIPHAIPIARITLGSPLDLQSSFINSEQLGGGIDVPDESDHVDEADLTAIKSLLNVGVWGGQLAVEGGSITIELDSTLLDSHTEDEIKEIVKQHVPPGVAWKVKYTTL